MIGGEDLYKIYCPRPGGVFNTSLGPFHSCFAAPCISLNLHLAKCYRQPYHTTPPPNCQGLFSFGGTEPGGNGKTATPPPARPRAGALPQRTAARRPGSLLKVVVSCGCYRGGRHATATALQRGSARKGWPSFFFAPAGRPMQRPHGACWAITAKGMGCPLLPSSSPHPTACGPTPSHPARLGPRLPAAAGRPRPLLAGHGGARVGASAALFPDRRQGGGWARASRSTRRVPCVKPTPCGAGFARA